MRWACGTLALLFLLLGIASFFVDEPLRRYVERTMNQRLSGYTVRIPKLTFHAIGGSVTLHGLTIVQQAHPDPPVAVIRSLSASTQWREVFSGHLVTDVHFVEPRLHVDLTQLRTEMKDETPLADRGWQRALEALYPFKINLLRVTDGDIVYVDEDPARPLHLEKVRIRAGNIRNIHSRDQTYPSTLHAEAVVFETGTARLDGHADFLAEPRPGVHTLIDLKNVPLDAFRPMTRRAHLDVEAGTFSATGDLEVGPKVNSLRISDMELVGLKADYRHSAATAGEEKAQQETVKQAARNASENPETDLRLAKLRIVDSEIGIVNEARSPGYRVFLSSFRATAENLSNGFRAGAGKLAARGKFQGGGAARLDATFRPATAKGPDFDLDVAIEGTPLTAMNDLLRSYGKFDVVAGTFSFFMELRVKNGAVDGYVKPLFKDMKVYDRRQDKEKSAFRKLYERLVGGVARLLENRERKEVATRADLSGPIDRPSSSTWQIVGRLLQNAFIRAILPGFDEELRKLGLPKKVEKPGKP